MSDPLYRNPCGLEDKTAFLIVIVISALAAWKIWDILHWLWTHVEIRW